MTAQAIFSHEQIDVYLEDRFWSAIKSMHANANKPILLTKHEAIALYAYTNCYPPFFEEINNDLRADETNQFITAIDSGLAKLPIFPESQLHRWAPIPTEELELLNSGEVVTNLGYTSTNLFPKRFDACDPDCDAMRIYLSDGRDISLYSDDVGINLHEILIPRGASFKLLGHYPESRFSYELLQVTIT